MRGKGNAAVQRLQQQVRKAQELIDGKELEAAALGAEVRGPLPFAMPGLAEG
ncbi:MAG: hypothetical protein L0Y66_01380 [Myxococcaceae bacterium]|nr:hypothetical protein [Myxococcaceae bacterium]MCI0672850.1 hypothetical protein [Myxococcaceae bacterium]